MKETKREICERHEPIAYYSGLGGLEVRHPLLPAQSAQIPQIPHG